MLLEDRLHKMGHRLFRYRSYTPLLIVPLFYVEANDSYWAHSERWDAPYELACFLVAMIGMAIRAATTGFAARGTSGRNTTAQRAETLSTTGLYSIVRNPLYFGNYLILLGVTLLSQNWELVLINTALFMAAYLPIILVEERFLVKQFGSEYLRYSAAVPCVVPSLRRWVPPELPWSWKMFLRRENDTLFSTVLAFTLIEHFRESSAAGGLRVDGLWLGIAIGTAAIWAVLKFLKRCTKVLKVQPAPEQQPGQLQAGR
jgi:protein-S-isoprenylcysteine O-methyltransferase Ste14